VLREAIPAIIDNRGPSRWTAAQRASHINADGLSFIFKTAVDGAGWSHVRDGGCKSAEIRKVTYLMKYVPRTRARARLFASTRIRERALNSHGVSSSREKGKRIFRMDSRPETARREEFGDVHRAYVHRGARTGIRA